MSQLTNGNKAVLINPKKGFRLHLLVFLLVTPPSGWYDISPAELIPGHYGAHLPGQ